MQSLLTIRESDVRPGSKDIDPAGFSHRETARAVVLNGLGQIALLKVTRHGYYKLPGGGLEKGEDAEEALRRELMEEIGCEVEVTGEAGEIVEYRDRHRKVQTSRCYTAIKVGEAQNLTFTERELGAGFEIVWAADIEDAITLVKSNEPNNYEGPFIVDRELKFLEAAQTLL